jgi:hypothetical protein
MLTYCLQRGQLYCLERGQLYCLQRGQLYCLQRGQLSSAFEQMPWKCSLTPSRAHAKRSPSLSWRWLSVEGVSDLLE